MELYLKYGNKPLNKGRAEKTKKPPAPPIINSIEQSLLYEVMMDNGDE